MFESPHVHSLKWLTCIVVKDKDDAEVKEPSKEKSLLSALVKDIQHED